MAIKGRHQSTCAEGKRTLEKIRAIEGVAAVVIGLSKGGKSVAGGGGGRFKLQRAVPGGFKGLLQTSKGVQELFVRVENGKEASVKLELQWLSDN